MAKNPLAAKRATSYAERLRLGIAGKNLRDIRSLCVIQRPTLLLVIHGEVKEEDEEDGRASPPPSAFSNRVTSVGTALPPLMGKAKVKLQNYQHIWTLVSI